MWTSLHIAAENDRIEVIETLVDAGVDIGSIEEVSCLVYTLSASRLFIQQMFTPLHVAAQNGHVEVVEILVKLGADVSVTLEVG